jgi:hypothetical protein
MVDFIIQYWAQFLFGLIIAGMGFACKWLSKRFKEQDTFRMALQALLRNEIIQSYNHYMDKEYCPIYAKENIEKMYEQYHALGGNGTITKLHDELLDLPTEPQTNSKPLTEN